MMVSRVLVLITLFIVIFYVVTLIRSKFEEIKRLQKVLKSDRIIIKNLTEENRKLLQRLQE